MTYEQAVRADERHRWASHFEGMADRMGSTSAATQLRAAASDMRADIAPEVVNEGEVVDE